jgi:AcrR family transcriptional regulator
MNIPASGAEAAAPAAGAWSALSPDEKRERLLSAAGDVFARHGLDAPMSEVADAAGAGVASLYRCFPSKHDLLAMLVAQRMDQIADAAIDALARRGDRWSALTDLLTGLVSNQSADNFLGEARVAVAENPDVIASSARAEEAIRGWCPPPRPAPRRPSTSCSTPRAPRAACAPTPPPWTCGCCSPPRGRPSRSSPRTGRGCSS